MWQKVFPKYSNVTEWGLTLPHRVHTTPPLRKEGTQISATTLRPSTLIYLLIGALMKSCNHSWPRFFNLHVNNFGSDVAESQFRNSVSIFN